MPFTTRIWISVFAPVRVLPRPARVSLLLFLVAGLADGVLMPFFALWAQKEGGVPTRYIGLLLGCYAGGELLATPFVGGIADRLGRRPVLLVSTMGVGLGFVLLHVTHGVLAAASTLVLIGVFESVLHPTAATVIADVVPADQARQSFALARVASSTGRLVGPAIGAGLARWSLGAVFLGAGASLLVGALAIVIFLPETWVSNSPAEEDDDDLTALTAVFRNRQLGALLLPVAILGIASSWIESVMPLYATHAGTLSSSGVGLLFTYAAALSVCFQLPTIRASTRMGGFSIVMISGVALALAFGSLLISPALPMLVGAVTLFAFSQMLSGPLTQSVVSELAPIHARATYMASFSVVNDLQDAAGPAIGIYLFALSTSLPWWFGMPVATGASLALALILRRQGGASAAAKPTEVSTTAEQSGAS